VEPRLVAARRRPGGSWRYTGSRGERRVVSPAVAAAALQMMEGVVGEGGTGSKAALPGIRVGGKTGTAQKLDPSTGRYFASRYLAWFVGTAPIEDPRIVTLVMLDEPKGLFRTGGMSAAPVFAEVAETQLARLGIDTKRPEAENPAPKLAARIAPTEDPKLEARPPVVPAPAQAPEPPRPPAVAQAPAPRLPSVEELGDRILLPDFRGLTLDQVRSIAAGKPIRIEAVGTGRAVAQEPEPGSIIAGPVRRVRIRFAQGEG
jgi:membrane peptidoglycan carboxypeptidase